MQRLTDGQTDRQTDSFLIAIPRLHSMQRRKNFSYNYLTVEVVKSSYNY